MSEVFSPCVRNCCLDDDDICLGCFRTIDEIIQWGESNDEEKQVILDEAEKRRGSRAMAR